MKASKIFFRYLTPILKTLPKRLTLEELKNFICTPEKVWNAVVIDRDSKRKPGQLPKSLIEEIEKMSHGAQNDLKTCFEFWAMRKDKMFGNEYWTVESDIFYNPEGKLTLRTTGTMYENPFVRVTTRIIRRQNSIPEITGFLNT